MKGCSLKCPWCSNPENIKPYPEKYYKDGVEGLLEGNLDLYKTNLKLLASQRAITIRISVIGHYTNDNENKVAIIDEIKKIAKNVLKVELIKGII